MHVTSFIKRNKTILAMGFALELTLLVFLIVTRAGNWNYLPFIFFVAFGIYLVALRIVNGGNSVGFEKISLIIFFGIVFRTTLLLSGPVFSFDLYRYFWDGKIGANGVNPYLSPPDAPELSSLRDANWELINHKDLKSGYPPVMQFFLEFLYASSHSVLAYKLSFFLFDIGTILTIFFILRQLGIDDKYQMVYAWAPLPIIEISQTGHNDSMMVFLMMMSFLLLLRERPTLSSLVMGMAVGAKLFPVFFVPVLFRRWGKTGTLVFFLVVAGMYLPFAGIGLRMFSGMLYNVNTTFFNGSVFPTLAAALASTNSVANPGFTAQIVVYFIYATFLLWAVLRSFRREVDSTQLMRMCFLLGGTVLLLNRAFFPWYATWILPFVVFYASRSWLLLSGSIFLSYLKYSAFPPPPYEGVDPVTALVIDLMQYLPFYALFAYELLTKRIVLRGSTDR